MASKLASALWKPDSAGVVGQTQEGGYCARVSYTEDIRPNDG